MPDQSFISLMDMVAEKKEGWQQATQTLVGYITRLEALWGDLMILQSRSSSETEVLINDELQTAIAHYKEQTTFQSFTDLSSVGEGDLFDNQFYHNRTAIKTYYLELRKALHRIAISMVCNISPHDSADSILPSEVPHIMPSVLCDITLQNTQKSAIQNVHIYQDCEAGNDIATSFTPLINTLNHVIAQLSSQQNMYIRQELTPAALQMRYVIQDTWSSMGLLRIIVHLFAALHIHKQSL